MYKYYICYDFEGGKSFIFLVLDYKLNTEENINKMISKISETKEISRAYIVPTFWKNLKN